MSIPGIQGQLLEVTVVGCTKLKDTEWISRQDPYVCIEYASTKYRTRTCTDGGKNPSFQEKFVFTLIEGLREFNVVVWNSNTITYDDFIGSGKVQLGKVLSQGYDDSSWALQDKKGRHSGEVRLIMHYANAKANKPSKSHEPSAPPYVEAPNHPQAPHYSVPPPPPHVTSYPGISHPSQPPIFPGLSYPSTYPPPPYSQPSAYPPPPYPPVSGYPPPPPPPHDSHYYPPPGAYPPLYPRPPY